jgi:hypothetical protein
MKNKTGKQLSAVAVSPTNKDWSETLEGDMYSSFVQHVDGVFQEAVINCYG